MKNIPKNALVLYIFGGVFMIGGLSFVPAGEWANVAGGVVIAAILCFFGYRKQRQHEDELVKNEAKEAWRLANAKADEEAREEEAARRREYGARYRKVQFSVAGVTFKNDDGKNRQTILKRKMKEAETLPIVVSLGDYEHEGSPAVAVMLDDERIGSVPTSHLPDVLPLFTEGKKMVSITADIEDFEGDDGKTVYRCDVTLSREK